MNHPKVYSLIPVKGCFVAVSHRKHPGMVVGHKVEGGTTYALVNWSSQGVQELHNVAELQCGFAPGHVVQDVPASNTRSTLGIGTVRNVRCIAGRYQVLVQMRDTGDVRWFPYENLVLLKDARMKYEHAEIGGTDSGERFRLKALAHALDSWNQVTGSLDRLDVDPLPHQIDLVHRIMTSDQSNWLIADDTGLGKTIEVGLLLAAMKRRKQARRVLVVCPAGMVRQWQDEMNFKFNEDFRIYGSDFNINHPAHWAGHDKVIVSIDRAKADRHLATFSSSGDWDIIVFDEAHHLSKIEGQAVTQRYQLAERLRRHTDAFIFLTGTPHQGNTLQFINLLLLLRPDIGRRFADMFTNPAIVSEVVLRNQKSRATDADGQFLFKGQDTRLIEVPLSESARRFNYGLQEYLRHGYAASEAGGNPGRAIGFVMTIYRKLASSSIAAIERALSLRLERLHGNIQLQPSDLLRIDLDDIEAAFSEGSDGRDDLDSMADRITGTVAGANPFFSGEQRHISYLLSTAAELKNADLKLDRFLSHIVDPVHKSGKKLLVFTEYRATQEYIVEALERRYPKSGIAQINGSMSLKEKLNNIAMFNEQARFMVSTEAGGEGINLHHNCNIMVNYDLPWNPGRLVQRAGRLYRYGQTERVIVFNLMADDAFDSHMLGMLLGRVQNIAHDMARVSPEFRDGLETEIVGELLERVDIASLLASNKTMDMERTKEDIEAAVMQAKEAKSQQEKLFTHVEGYDPDTPTALHTFDSNDVLNFLERIIPFQGIRIRGKQYKDRVLEIELPQDLRGRFGEFPPRATVVRITADRGLASQLRGVATMDFKSPFFSYLIEFAKSPEFKGEFSSIQGPESGTLGLYKLRWQNDQGVPREETLLPVFLPAGSPNATTYPRFFGNLLFESDKSPSMLHSMRTDKRRGILLLLDESAHEELNSRCTQLRHPNDVVLLSTADIVSK